jgi:hypothetical protein
VKLTSITFLSLALSYWIDYLGFITEGKLVAVLITPSLGVPNWSVIYIINTAPSEAPKKSPLRHHKAWEDLHNLIGCPQEITTEAPQSLGRSPQLNWRSQRNPLSRLGF